MVQLRVVHIQCESRYSYYKSARIRGNIKLISTLRSNDCERLQLPYMVIACWSGVKIV